MQVDEDTSNVVVFAPFGDDTSRVILTLLKLRYQLLQNDLNIKLLQHSILDAVVAFTILSTVGRSDTSVFC